LQILPNTRAQVIPHVEVLAQFRPLLPVIGLLTLYMGTLPARAASFPNLIKPLWMLGDGGNADEENQHADDVGLEPQDRIAIHGGWLHARRFFKIPS
jgi:hypothetical protein